jgi:hypothetical protein
MGAMDPTQVIESQITETFSEIQEFSNASRMSEGVETLQAKEALLSTLPEITVEEVTEEGMHAEEFKTTNPLMFAVTGTKRLLSKSIGSPGANEKLDCVCRIDVSATKAYSLQTNHHGAGF